jgi:hypothetical protein
MTSSISSSVNRFQQSTPLSALQKTLASDIKAGTIKPSDERALTSALSSIDSTLQAGRTSGGGKGRPSPEAGKAKVEGSVNAT